MPLFESFLVRWKAEEVRKLLLSGLARAVDTLHRPWGLLAALVSGAGAGFPALFLLAMGYRRRWISEDAFIDLRIVQHLLSGHGPVFNIAERVEAYTNPLWVALLAGWGALGGPLDSGAVSAGLGLSIIGVLAAQAGAWKLASRLEPGNDRVPQGAVCGRAMLPLGMIVFVAVPAVWDFVTSGLEMGLVVAWLGGVFWLLARCQSPSLLASCVTAFCIGLGPLIRPDLAIFSAAFLVALGAARAEAPGRRWLRGNWVELGLVALSLPVAYQVFRMGYFAALAPNTALAKEAGYAHWEQGWRYARDLVGTYALWVPLALLLGWWVVLVRRAWGARAIVISLLAPVLAALLHAAYVIRAGGDFMHGRLLLPALFGVLLPTATVMLPLSVRAGWRPVASSGIVVVWAVGCALWLRVPYRGEIGPWAIADERGFYVRYSGVANPMRLSDYEHTAAARIGRAMRDRVRVLVIDSEPEVLATEIRPGRELPLAAEVSASTRAAVAAINIGILGYAAGPGVHVVDRLGLADPIASRLELRMRQRPGHEKVLPEAWIAARFADRRAAISGYPEAQEAAAALDCGPLVALRQAVEAPVTLDRFTRNLRKSFGLYRLRIPADPAAARTRFCST